MPRYYFHVRHGEELDTDPEGALFESLEHAKAEAVLAAREMLAEKVALGEVIEARVFELTSEDGLVVAEVPFMSVLRFS